MSYMKLMLLAPVYLEINTATKQVESVYTQVELDELDCSNSASTCEFQIKSPLTAERYQPKADTSRASKFDILGSLPPDLDRNYLNFPFFTDRKTFAYLKHPDTNIMFIMRGLSGSGKSSIVNIIKSSFKQVTVCSADDYFCQDGSYKFQQELLTPAHEACQRKAKQACRNRVPVVVIDNTNVRKWEFRFYVELAKTEGYVVVFVQPKTPWRWNASELAARNKHGVPADQLQLKIAKFDDLIPIYYGWFLNEKRSRCLSRLCSHIFIECLSKFPKMKQDFLRQLKVKFGKTDDETVQEILSGYYSSESSRSPLLHCTAKFCAWGKVPGAKDYHERPDVQQSCGQMFALTITGLVITKKTLGARVSLGPSESLLFARPEEKEWGSQNMKSPQGRRSLAVSVTENLEENSLILRKGNKKGKDNQITIGKKNKKRQSSGRNNIDKVSNNSTRKKNGRFYDKEELVSQHDQTDDYQHFSETGSALVPGMDKNDEAIVSLSDMFPLLKFTNHTRSAHFTIKTARGVESKDVNYDVLRACDLEASSVYTTSDFVAVSRGQACYYSDGLCCVYFDKPLCVRTLFSGYY